MSRGNGEGRVTRRAVRVPTWLWALLGLMAAVLAVSTALRATEPDHADWQLFKQRFVTDEGRVVDTGNQGISHSESQGYGLLLAAGHDDPDTFARIWAWTRANLRVRPDHLFAWQYDPHAPGGPVPDPNNASDGGLLIAWALARAAATWEREDYRLEAQRVVADLLASATLETPEATLLLPGATGFVEDGVVTVNLSYWLFPAFTELAEVWPSPKWQALTATGLRLLEVARFGPFGLPPDWLDLTDPPTPAAGFAPVYGYNAIRIPLHLIWAGLGSAGRLEPYLAFERAHRGTPPATIDLLTGEASPEPLSSGGRAILTLARRALGRPAEPLPPLTDELDYFAACLLLLTKLAISEGSVS